MVQTSFCCSLCVGALAVVVVPVLLLEKRVLSVVVWVALAVELR